MVTLLMLVETMSVTDHTAQHLQSEPLQQSQPLHHHHYIITITNSSQIQYSGGSWRPFTFRKQLEDTDPLTTTQPAFLDVNSTLKEYIHHGEVEAVV